MMELVSVITPAHGARTFIGRAVRSVISQTYPDWEMLIVSDDDVDYERVLEESGITDSRLKFLATPIPGSGPSTARNIALESARGSLIAPLDADDLFYPARLAVLVPETRAIGMSGDNVLVVDDVTGVFLGSVFPQSENVRWIDEKDYARISTPMTFVFRREVARLPWDEDIRFAEDTVFNLRAIEACRRVPIVQRVLHEYRSTPNSLCNSPDSSITAELGYTKILQKLDENGLGFVTERGKAVTRRMMENKRQLNRQFAQLLEAGICNSFQDFVSQGYAEGAELHPHRQELG